MLNKNFETELNTMMGDVEKPRQDEASLAAWTTGRMNTFAGACC